MLRGLSRGLLGSRPLLASDHVGGVPVRPMVLRSRPFECTVAMLCFPQKLRHRRHVQVAESAPGETRRDLLEQEAVAVRVTERGIREVGPTLRIPAWQASVRSVDMEAAPEMEHLAHVR